MLWLCGPPGVGKTTAAWEIFCQLTRAQVPAGYADIDQLGMCYPEPATDPGRHRMKARNLAAVAANFQSAGARCLVVSGVADPHTGVPTGLFPHAALTLCRLRAGREELRRRFTGRGGGEAGLAEVLAEADILDAGGVAGECVDTSGLPAAEVARLVRERCGGWPVLTAAPAAGQEACGTQEAGGTHDTGGPGGRILLLCGVTGAGKSAAGFEIHLRCQRGGHTCAYIDLDQIGFCHPAPAHDPASHRVKAANLAALWRAYRAAGARHLVVTGQVEDETAAGIYATAVPEADITLCRLHAGPGELARRIARRGQGHGWDQPGDPLRGQSPARLARIAAGAAAADAALDRGGPGAVRVGTDGRTAGQVAGEIIARTGWPAATAGDLADGLERAHADAPER